MEFTKVLNAVLTLLKRSNIEIELAPTDNLPAWNLIYLNEETDDHDKQGNYSRELTLKFSYFKDFKNREDFENISNDVDSFISKLHNKQKELKTIEPTRSIFRLLSYGEIRLLSYLQEEDGNRLYVLYASVVYGLKFWIKK